MPDQTPRVTLALLLACGALAPGAAGAQAYPTKPIRIIVPFPAGGGVDYIGRIMAKGLSARMGQQVIVDNRPGANAILGLENLKSSAPDGYTIAAASAGPLAVNPFTYAKLPHDTVKDFTYIARMVEFPLLLVTHPSLPVKNVKELIALARARPNEISYSSPGVGNTGHLAAALFDSLAKIKTVHVPYKGTAPAVVAALSGETQLTWSSIPTILPHVRAGRARALGVGNAKRLVSLPDFPTVAEAGVPGYECVAWGGMIGPANIPRDIVARLNKEILAVLAQKDVIDRMLADGTVPAPTSAEEFLAYEKAELKKWGEVVKLAGIKPE
ncbi:MAG: tripartite tricarboxylate transporter substrate binding protein [Burkholderiales bacterium]|nr:tripartite tricarboxylate transporter substrate binding protein [Burkholderiales bacterium]